MTNQNRHQSLYPHLLLFVFMNSCNGQKKPPVSEDSQEINKLSLLPLKQNLREDGNLWIGTRITGLYKYDGKTFKQFSDK